MDGPPRPASLARSPHPHQRVVAVGAVLEELVRWTRRLEATTTSSPFGNVALSRTQFEALFLITHSKGDVTPGKLAKALGVTPGAVSQLLTGLIDGGFVEQAPDPQDARRHLLSPSDQAMEFIDRMERGMAQALEPRFKNLTDAELEILATLLGRTEP